MKRKFEEKREVTEIIHRTVCDICGEVVMDNKPFVRLIATDNNAPANDVLDICTPSCLEKNIKGIRCVLDGKMIPAVARDNTRKDDTECYEKAAPTMRSTIVIPLYIGK